jgi:hypothetical protein
MAIPFNPPNWLIQEYINRKHPIQEASEGIQGALQTYAQTRQAQEQKEMQNQQFEMQKQQNYIKAFEAGGPELAAEVAAKMNYQNPPSLPGRTAVQAGPGGTAGIVNQPQMQSSQVHPGSGIPMTGNEMAAQQSLPAEHGSTIDAWNAFKSNRTPNANQAAGMSQQTPGPLGFTPDQFNQFGQQGKYGEKQRQNALADLQYAKGLKDLSQDPNAPQPVMTKEDALKRGQVAPGTKILDDGSAADSRFASNQAATLRGQFIKDSDEFQTYGKRLQTVIASAQKPDAAGDISMLYSYMKMLDPNSAVREGELAIASQAGSIPQNIVGAYNKAVNGERMSPEIRQQFVDRAKQIYRTQAQIQKGIEGTYTKMAASMPGVDPKQVIIDYSIPLDEQPSKPPPPKVGQEMGGYVFQGGDPGDPASWRKQ